LYIKPAIPQNVTLGISSGTLNFSFILAGRSSFTFDDFARKNPKTP
jgi:hypothetical protein